MRTRMGPGPVFAWECRASSRRWRWFAGRLAFGGALLLGVWAVWMRHEGRDMVAGAGAVVEGLYLTSAPTQLALVALVTPAVTAGAICREKAKGSPLHLLTIEVSDPELVLGKLAARLVPIAAWMACGLPIPTICTLLGGLDPEAVLGASAVTAGVALPTSAVTTAPNGTR